MTNYRTEPEAAARLANDHHISPEPPANLAGRGTALARWRGHSRPKRIRVPTRHDSGELGHGRAARHAAALSDE